MDYLAEEILAKSSEITLRAFKRQRVTPPQASLAFEQFYSIFDETEVGSRDRAMVIQNLFQEHGSSSRYLSYFV